MSRQSSLRFRFSAAAAVAVLTLPWAVSVIHAQDPAGGGAASGDPFGGAMPAGEPAGDPFGGAGAVGGDPATEPSLATPGAASRGKTRDVETDVLVLSVRDSKPTTPEQLGRAIRVLVDYGRGDEARKYITALRQLQPEPATLAKLHATLGGAFLLRLADNETVGPEGKQLAEEVAVAAYQVARDPQRIQAAIDQLSLDDPAARQAALADLKPGGEDAVVALLATLANEAQVTIHRQVRDALVHLGAEAIPPALAASRSTDVQFRQRVYAVLAALRAREAITILLRPALLGQPADEETRAARQALAALIRGNPTREQAVDFLRREVQEKLHGELGQRPDLNDQIAVWRWDEAARKPVADRLSAVTASLAAAQFAARELFAFSPTNLPDRRLYAVTRIAVAKRTQGLDQPLETSDPATFQELQAFGAAAIEDLLTHALRIDEPAAAAAACEVLGTLWQADQLRSPDGRPALLVQTLGHHDRRVRFAALEAILRLDATTSYPGSSFVVDALSYFARAADAPQVLIVNPRTDHAQDLAGLLVQTGYQARHVPTGRDGVRQALQGADLDFLLVSDAVDRPAVGELLQQVRRDPRTARLPIAVLAHRDRFLELKAITQRDPYAETFPRPHDVAGVALIRRVLSDLVAGETVDQPERMRQAATAYQHLNRLASDPEQYGYYDLLRLEAVAEHGLSVAALAGQAAELLGNFGTPRSQLRLATIASDQGLPIELRRAAAQAFDRAVRRRGLLLTQRDILLQYDRYNRSAALDADTQAVLGAILDSIEAPTAVEGGEPPATDGKVSGTAPTAARG